MLGLDDYESSDEEEYRREPPAQDHSKTLAKEDKSTPISGSNGREVGVKSRKGKEKAVSLGEQEEQDDGDGQAASNKSQPAYGPSPAPPGESNDGLELTDTTNMSHAEIRELIHSLTLPPVPNLSIPPSPPGSPNPAVTTKFEKFLELKKQGIHYNDRLAASTEMRNPNLYESLIDFAGIGRDYDQYATSLPDDLAPVPSYGLPAEWYAEQLEKHQAQSKSRAEAQRKAEGRAVDFVASTSAASRLSDDGNG